MKTALGDDLSTVQTIVDETIKWLDESSERTKEEYEEKQKSVDSFQTNPKKKVFIGNIKSAGVGITLTQATVVIFNSFDWVPGINEQAEDRAYRIGQKNCVNVYYQLFEKTISTRMWDVLRNKKDIISTIMGDTKLTDNEVLELLMDKFLLENG